MGLCRIAHILSHRSRLAQRVAHGIERVVAGQEVKHGDVGDFRGATDRVDVIGARPVYGSWEIRMGP
jgi:hypothetical protein